VDSTDAIKDFKKAPAWLKKLLNAYADGINYWLYKNCIKPALLTRFQPWYLCCGPMVALVAISTGGISEGTEEFLQRQQQPLLTILKKNLKRSISTGSNGFAFSFLLKLPAESHILKH
jgi:acyl-homoserine lactone acylase PvdQ